MQAHASQDCSVRARRFCLPVSAVSPISRCTSRRRMFSALLSPPAAFTPQHALIGGTLLGVATVANLLLNGRVLGCSGAVKGIIQGDRQMWRPAFVLGMVGMAPVLATLLPGSFEILPATTTVFRTALAGFLVGLGSSMGNGCTSGHGICGSARLSVRSMLYTCTFMVSGALMATLSGSATALGVAPTAVQFSPVTPTELSLSLALGAGGTAVLALLGWVGSQAKGDTAKTLATLSSAAVGALFATGLALAGMTRPSKVVAFLSVVHPGFDLSLIFVMAAAVGVSIFAFRGVMGKAAFVPFLPTKPLLSSSYTLPTSSSIDTKLLLGGVLFGCGWGLAGICPGPALATIASPTFGAPLAAWLAAMLVGMWAEPAISKQLL